MTPEQMHREAHAKWNALGRLPLRDWLVHSVTPQDLERLKAVGNCVMPKVARLALHVHMHEQLRRQ